MDDIIKDAEQGNADAQFKLGVMYYKGDGVKEDTKEAFKWFQKAAQQGNAAAQARLGFMYENGESVKQDYQEAFKRFQKAAEQEYVRDQDRLKFKHRHLKGKGVKEAFKRFQKAAQQGDAGAQYELGLMYHRGEGVDQDNEEAFNWFQEAIRQGNEKTKEFFISLLEKELDEYEYENEVIFISRDADKE